MGESLKCESDGRNEKILEFLSQEGFRPEKVSENSIKLKYQGRTIWVDTDEDDETFYQVVFANIWKIESPEELFRAYEATSKASRLFKVSKAVVNNDETNVWISAEQFEATVDEFLQKLIRLIRIVHDQGEKFWDLMRDLEKQSRDMPGKTSPVPITLIATTGNNEIARCDAKVDCQFLDVCSVDDQWFLQVGEDTPSSFVIELENEHYPVEVHFQSEGNKFMLTDPNAISAVRGVALGIHKVTLQ